jgi:hypothetical protein
MNSTSGELAMDERSAEGQSNVTDLDTHILLKRMQYTARHKNLPF